MKRSILISIMLVMFLLATGILAQDTATRPVKYGIKAGVGLANLTGDDKDFVFETATDTITVSPSSKMGIDFGLWLQFKLSPQIAIQPEVLYVSKGAKYEEGTDKVTIKANYIQVPVLFKFLIPTKGKIAPNIFAGPFFGFKASAKAKYETGAGDSEEDLTDAKSTEFGVTFGGGIDIAAGEKGVITLDARYDLGMSNVIKEVEAVQPKIKTTNIAFFIGYGF